MMAYFYLFELKLKSIDRILNIYGLDYDTKCRSLLLLGVKSDRFVASSVMLGLVSESFTFPLVKKYILFFY